MLRSVTQTPCFSPVVIKCKPSIKSLQSTRDPSSWWCGRFPWPRASSLARGRMGPHVALVTPSSATASHRVLLKSTAVRAAEGEARGGGVRCGPTYPGGGTRTMLTCFTAAGCGDHLQPPRCSPVWKAVLCCPAERGSPVQAQPCSSDREPGPSWPLHWFTLTCQRNLQ